MGFSTRWHSVASPCAGMLRELCRLLLPPGLPLSLLWCGAGSFPLPQAALAISPELCSDSCHLTFFFTYGLGKQEQVLWEGIGHGTNKAPWRTLLSIFRGVFLPTGDVCGKIPCASRGPALSRG